MKSVYFISYEATWLRKFLFVKWEKKQLRFYEIGIPDIERIEGLPHLLAIAAHLQTENKCDSVSIINFKLLRKEINRDAD